MATTGRAGRRADALSREQIVAAAIAILDADGEAALTVRALAARLATGAGALYHHVAGKDDLLAATTDHVVTRLVAGLDDGAPPRASLRALALGLFDAIDAHPWVGAQLARAPWRTANVVVFEGIGSRLQALDVPEPALFDAATALLSYVLGVAGQNAANARHAPAGTTRPRHLAEAADRWLALDPGQYPFLHRVAEQLRDHDDRAQFAAGLDLVLAGIDALGRDPGASTPPAGRAQAAARSPVGTSRAMTAASAAAAAHAANSTR